MKNAVQVVKHDYKTRMSKKYFGNVNENYPRKNWSSVVLWNCKHKNSCLMPDFEIKKSCIYTISMVLQTFNWGVDVGIGLQ